MRRWTRWSNTRTPLPPRASPEEMKRRLNAGLFLTGNTYPHYTVLRGMGGEWDRVNRCWLMPDLQTKIRGQAVVDGSTAPATPALVPQQGPAQPLGRVDSTPKASDYLSVVVAALRALAPEALLLPIGFQFPPLPPAETPLLDWAANQKQQTVTGTFIPAGNGFAQPAAGQRLSLARPRGPRQPGDDQEEQKRSRKDGYDRSWESRLASLTPEQKEHDFKWGEGT